MQGFQTPIESDSFIVDGMGGVSLGNVHSERGLTYYEVVLSGHMVPQFSPVVRADFFCLWLLLTVFVTGCVPDYGVPDGLQGFAVKIDLFAGGIERRGDERGQANTRL